MESTIYLVEATALIEGVHLLKQLIYDGTVQVLVPRCTLNTSREAYQQSITPKDASKQQQNRQSGRPARKEQPLFDINPRTVWEFIERAQSETGIVGVTFQKENEIFTQWKDEEERMAKAETPLSPPSSFADALLRKLTIGDQKEEVKGPIKPKLTARTKSTKSAWKIDKVPTVSSEGMSQDTKALFSCLLWFVHEAERNPLQPVKYVLLARDPDITNKAIELGLATSTVHQVHAQLVKEHQQRDSRKIKGELEQQFPEILVMSQALATGSSVAIEASPIGLGGLIPQHTASSVLSHELKPETKKKIPENLFDQKEAANSTITNDLASSKPEAGSIEPPRTTSHLAVRGADDAGDVQTSNSPTTQTYTTQAETTSQNGFQISQKSSSPNRTSAKKEEAPLSDNSSELESDEEIIVFNPRNKRTSGLAGSNSRPGSSGSFVAKTYKGGVQTNSRPTTSSGLFSLDGQIDSILLVNANGPASGGLHSSSTNRDDLGSETGLKTPMESKLKAQSPVFTPGKPFISTSATNPEETENDQLSPTFGNGTTPPTGPRISNHRNSNRPMQQKDNGQDLLRLQQENSQRIIQRQRDVIQRQSKAVEANVKTVEQASPRLIQMEPTDNPTIIDPDAFDRSYVVQPPSKPANRQVGEIRRPKGSRRTAKDGERASPKEPPKPKTPSVEPDIEYVLKSGSPRGSTRGKGKLWTP